MTESTEKLDWNLYILSINIDGNRFSTLIMILIEKSEICHAVFDCKIARAYLSLQLHNQCRKLPVVTHLSLKTSLVFRTGSCVVSVASSVINWIYFIKSKCIKDFSQNTIFLK